jgi:hypothetical protein
MIIRGPNSLCYKVLGTYMKSLKKLVQTEHLWYNQSVYKTGIFPWNSCGRGSKEISKIWLFGV